MKKSLLVTLIMLLISSTALADTCPDLLPETHPDPLQSGWQISPFSPSKDTLGSHSFAQVQISNYQVARKNTVSCHYDQGQLIIYKIGQFNHADDPSLWFHSYEYDKCSRSLIACVYNSF